MKNENLYYVFRDGYVMIFLIFPKIGSVSLAHSQTFSMENHLTHPLSHRPTTADQPGNFLGD